MTAWRWQCGHHRNRRRHRRRDRQPQEDLGHSRQDQLVHHETHLPTHRQRDHNRNDPGGRRNHPGQEQPDLHDQHLEHRPEDHGDRGRQCGKGPSNPDPHGQRRGLRDRHSRRHDGQGPAPAVDADNPGGSDHRRPELGRARGRHRQVLPGPQQRAVSRRGYNGHPAHRQRPVPGQDDTDLRGGQLGHRPGANPLGGRGRRHRDRPP